MAKIKLKRSNRLPWEGQNTLAQTEAQRVSAAALKRLRTRNVDGICSDETPRPIPRRKIKPRKATTLESQFDVGPGPRSSKWWDLKKDGINNSGVALWLTDRHQFWLRYVCGYDMQIYSDSIEFGNIFHWLIEKWLKKEFANNTKAEFWETMLRRKYHKSWIANWKGAALTPKNRDTQESFYVLAGAMFPTYAKYYASDLKAKTLGIEFEFCVQNPKPRFPLYGTLDHAMKSKKYGRELIDHKTSSWINEVEIDAALPLNFQLGFYAHVWALHTGHVVDHVTHDVIRRTTMKPKKNESLAFYGRRVGKDVARAPEHFFMRFRAPMDAAKLTAFRANILTPILIDIENWASGKGPHYPNPNALIGRYGPCRLFTPIVTGNFAGIPRKRPTTRGIEI